MNTVIHGTLAACLGAAIAAAGLLQLPHILAAIARLPALTGG